MSDRFGFPSSGQSPIGHRESELPTHLRPRESSGKGCGYWLLGGGVGLFLAILIGVALRNAGDIFEFPDVDQWDRGTEARKSWPLQLPDGFRNREVQIEQQELDEIRQALDAVMKLVNDDEDCDSLVDSEALQRQARKSSFFKSWDINMPTLRRMSQDVDVGLNGYELIRVAAAKVVSDSPRCVELCCHVSHPDGYYIDAVYWFQKSAGDWKLYDWMEIDEGVRFSDEIAILSTEIPMHQVNRYNQFQACFSRFLELYDEGETVRAKQQLQTAEGFIPNIDYRDQLFILVAWQYLTLDDTAKVNSILNRVQNRKTPGIHFLGALASFQDSRYTHAINAAQEYIKQVGESPAMYEILYYAHRAMGDYETALEYAVKEARCLSLDRDALGDLVSVTPFNQLSVLDEPLGIYLRANPDEVAGLFIELADRFENDSLLPGIRYLQDHPKCTGSIKLYLEGLQAFVRRNLDTALEKVASAIDNAEDGTLIDSYDYLMVRIANRSRQFRKYYDLSPDKSRAAEQIGDNYSSYSPIDAPFLEEIQRKHLETFPDDVKAKYNLAVAIGDQGKYDEAIALLNQLDEQVTGEEDPMHAWIRNSRAWFRFESGQIQEMMDETDDAEGTFRRMSETAWQMDDTERLRELIGIMEGADENSQLLKFGKARLAAMQGEIESALEMLKEIRPALEADGPDHYAVTNLWLKLLKRGGYDDNTPRPELGQEDFDSYYRDYVWDEDKDGVALMKNWGGGMKVPEKVGQLASLREAYRKRDFPLAVMIGERLYEQVGEFEDYEIDDIRIKLAIARFATGQYRKAVTSLPNKLKTMNLLEDDSLDIGGDGFDAKAALPLVLDFLNGEQAGQATSVPPKMRNKFSARRNEIYGWFRALETPNETVDKFSRSLPAWFNVSRYSSEVRFLMKNSVEDHENWIRGFFGDQLATDAVIRSVENESGFQNGKGYLCHVDDLGFLIGFHNVRLQNETAAVPDGQQELLKRYQATVSVQVIQDEGRDSTTICEVPWLTEKIVEFADGGDRLVAVYFENESKLLAPADVTSWLVDGRKNPRPNDVTISLADHWQWQQLPEEIEKQQQLLRLHPDDDNPEKYQVKVRMNYRMFTEEMWMDVVAWHRVGTNRFTIEAKVLEASRFQPELRSGRHVEMYFDDIVDWRVKEGNR